MAAAGDTFVKVTYAAELAQWLSNRASPQDTERCKRFLTLIQQTAGRAGGQADKLSSPSAIRTGSARAAKAGMLQTAPVRPASACEGGWLHTGTVASLRRAMNSSTLNTSASLKATASRPGTAAPALGDKQQQRPMTGPLNEQQQQQQQQKQQLKLSAVGQPAIATSRPGTAATAGSATAATAAATAAAGAAGAQATPRFANPLSVTTSHATYGLKELYPELYATILPIARPDPCPNKNFISEWGEAMKQGAEQAWKPYLQSTYEVHNHIATASKPGSADHKQRADSALAAWVGKQHLYYGDVFGPAQRAAIEKLLAQLQGDERRALVDTLRQMHSVLQPDRTKPFSHAEHKQQFSVEDEETTKLMKAQTKIRTMGMPKQAKVMGLKIAPVNAPATAAAATTAPAAKAPAKKKKAVTAADMIETLVSNVPIKQAVASVLPATSTYNTAFRAAPASGLQMQPAPFKDVNVGFGHVNTTLYPTQIPGGVIPLPAHFVTQSRLPCDAPSGDDMKTTHRNAYMPRSQADVMRSVAAAQEQIAESQAARNKSFIPLSKAGIQYGSSAQWGSIYGGDFKDKQVDLTANHAMAQAVGAMFNGPTISWGKIAGMRAQRPAAA